MDKQGYSATIGFFDGVHKGHQYVISRLRDDAVMHGLESMVLTFRQHPRQVLQSEYIPKLLSPGEVKVKLLQETGIDRVEALDFTLELSQMSAFEFMKMLKQKFNVCRLLIGYDNRFGHNREEGFEDYQRYGKELGMEVVGNDCFQEEGQGVSSSIIRRLLLQGIVAEANKYLGRKYGFAGEVVHGFGEGRKIGFPTANMNLDKCQLIPKRGVYAVNVRVEGRDAQYLGMMNIGVRPTYGSFSETVEVNIFNFDEEIYGKIITVEIIDRVRDERKFSSVEELTKQLDIDRRNILKYE